MAMNLQTANDLYWKALAKAYKGEYASAALLSNQAAQAYAEMGYPLSARVAQALHDSMSEVSNDLPPPNQSGELLV